jgi:rare lipoprotein A
VIRLRCLALLLAMTGCAPQAPPPAPHYVLGEAYQAGGVWYYPREDFSLDETGLAAVIPATPGSSPRAREWITHLAAALTGAPPRLTADGEMFDQTALAGAHPTLQLPALARITNLENGHQVLVRINDRTPASPDRLVEITRRTAELLAAADPQAIRVRLQVLEGESRRLVAELREEGPHLAVATAPAGAVQAETLAPPPGAAQAAVARTAAPQPRPSGSADSVPAAVPLRLPEVVTATPVRPTTLTIDCGDFAELQYAELMRARLSQLGARTTTSYDAPRDRAYMVRIGPLPTVAAAEAMRRRAAAAGATDARIVVE